MLVGWPIHTPAGHGPTGSSGRQPELGLGVRGTSTAAGPGGGAALGGGATVAPPPIPRPDRQQPALSALQPVAIANGPPPATRQQVVLLPHTRTELTSIPPVSRRTGRVTGMDQDNSLWQQPARSDGSTRVIAANLQWHDAELALKVARHCFERWRVAGHRDTPSPATMHAYHTHVALHEAARSIDTLIETFRVEANARITAPANGADVPTQRGDHAIVENPPTSMSTTLAEESTQLT